jgi:hypothetical protein
MNAKDFFGTFASKYLWKNILAMLVVIVILCFGVKYGLDIYTHHGEGIPVPNIKGMDYENALRLLEQDGLQIEVSDSGYNKRMPANCILAQSPGYGTKVKEGHVIYVTVNSPSSPSFAIPDIVDNSSLREAEAKLMAIGFKLLPPKLIPGEKDWVYGVLSRGRRVSSGDHVPIDIPLQLIVGNGDYDDESGDIDYTGPQSQQDDNTQGDVDEFEEVKEPPTGSSSSSE